MTTLPSFSMCSVKVIYRRQWADVEVGCWTNYTTFVGAKQYPHRLYNINMVCAIDELRARPAVQIFTRGGYFIVALLVRMLEANALYTTRFTASQAKHSISQNTLYRFKSGSYSSKEQSRGFFQRVAGPPK
jgi:hypothetical protein